MPPGWVFATKQKVLHLAEHPSDSADRVSEVTRSWDNAVTVPAGGLDVRQRQAKAWVYLDLRWNTREPLW